MPHNKKGDHYANPAYGKMMEGGKSKAAGAMAAYGEKAAEYMKAGYMINRLEIEYAENGFVVKCHWEEPKKMKKNGEMSMTYMEPTVKVFKTVPEVQRFVKEAFNEQRHMGVSYPGENGTKPKAPLRNTNKGVKGKKGNPHGMHY